MPLQKGVNGAALDIIDFALATTRWGWVKRGPIEFSLCGLRPLHCITGAGAPQHSITRAVERTDSCWVSGQLFSTQPLGSVSSNIGVCVHCQLSTHPHNTRTLTHTHPHTSSQHCRQTRGHAVAHTRQATRTRKHASEQASSHALGRARARESCYKKVGCQPGVELRTRCRRPRHQGGRRHTSTCTSP